MSAGVHHGPPSFGGRHHGHHVHDEDDDVVRQPSAFLRFLRHVPAVLGTALLFVLCLVVAVLVHLRLQVGLRVVADRVNALLADSFQGKVEIRRIGAIGPFGVSGVDALVDDPRGQQVLFVRGAGVRVATIAAARSALFGKPGPLVVGVRNVHVDDLDVLLDSDEAGHLRLLDALAPRHPSPPSEPSARPLRIEASRITLDHARAHGQMGAGAQPMDVELRELASSVTYAPDELEADVSRLKVLAHRIAQGLDLGGALVAHVKRAGDELSGLSGHVDWRGIIGSSPQTLSASIDDQRVNAVLEMPRVAPEDLATLLPGGSFTDPGTLRLEAGGTLPAIDLDLRTALGAAALRVHGHVKAAEEKSAVLAFEGSDLDAHVFSSGAPVSRLGLRGDVAATMAADGKLHGDLAMRFLGGTVGPRRLPTASLRASATRARADDLRGDAEIVIDEPAAPTRAAVDWALLPRSRTVSFSLDSNAPDLDRLPELDHLVGGALHVAAKGTVDLGRTSVDARVQADGRALTQGANRVEAANVAAHLYGTFARLAADVTVHAAQVNGGPVRFSALDVTAAGLVRSPHVTVRGQGVDTPNIDASVDLSLGGGVEAKNLQLSAWREGVHALLSADRVVSGASGLRVEGARIEGLGDPATASLETTPGGLRIRAVGAGIDLGRLGRLAHLSKVRRGRLSFDTDLDLRRERASGHTKLDLDGGELGDVRGLAAHVDVTMDGRKLKGKAHVQAEDVATVDVWAANLAIGGAGPLSAAGWRQAWGDVTFDLHGNLARIEALVPPDRFPLSEATGDVVLKGHLLRESERDPDPDLKLGLVTNGLLLTPKTTPRMTLDGVYVMPPPAWRLAGIDFDADAAYDGHKRSFALASRVRDPKGPLAEVKATAEQVPLDDVFRGGGRLRGDLQTMPFDVEVTVPERGLGSMPDMLKQNYLSGKLTANLSAKGTMRRPVVHVGAKVHRSHLAVTSGSLPIDFDLAGDYDGEKAKVTVDASSSGKQLMHVDTDLDAAAAGFLSGGAPAGAAHPWTASARAHFDGFPLEAVGALADHVITGQVTGDVTVSDVHKDGRAEATLNVDSLGMGGVVYPSAKVQAKADGKALEASLRIQGKDGFFETNAHGGARWGARVAPALASGQPLDVALSAKNFQIGGFLPFVNHWLDELDGRLDADTQVALDPRTRGVKLSGSIGLDKGRLEATAGGGELHDVSAKIAFQPDGVVTLQKLSASAMSGRIEASGSARLSPAGLAGARAVVVIPPSAPFPLDVGGAPIGDVDGRIEITESPAPSGKGTDLKVEVPHLRVALPDQLPNSVQALGPIPGLQIGAYRGQPLKFVLVPLDPVKPKETSQGSSEGGGLVVQTHVADLQVVRSTQLKVDLVGNVQAKTGGPETQVTGQIHLKPGGTLSVQGRTFKVESGTVSFVGGDPSNPEVVVKAGWTAPDGTVVYANFVGPLKTGKVTLTSEPALPREEIVELLLFGSTGGKQVQSPQGNTETSAIGTVGGEATQPLNHALDQLGLGAISTKVDTSESSAPKPEVEVQIARDISLQIAVVLGQPPPGVNPDRTLLTLDWRFLSRWSLSSTLGDAGTTIFDVLWQRRY